LRLFGQARGERGLLLERLLGFARQVLPLGPWVAQFDDVVQA
jgi:hypothetical protein